MLTRDSESQSGTDKTSAPSSAPTLSLSISSRELSTLLILIAVGLVTGGIMTPNIIGANDRSRWLTVRALVHDGTYAIGHRTPLPGGGYQDEGIAFERGWGSIDKILHPETQTFYSSKPPLLSTIVAGVYWLVNAMTGWSIVEDQLPVIKIVLFLINVIPFALYCWMIARLVDRFGQTEWGRVYACAAACFGTFVTSFSTVLNNHTPAAVTALATIYFATAPEKEGRTGRHRYFLTGLFAGLTAAFELPAALLVVWAIGWSVWRGKGRAGWAAAAGIAIPVAAWFITNYVAIGQFKPAYAQAGTNWYLYEGSAWANPKKLDGIHRAGLRESKFEYAANLTIGHHGLFSLTPVLALALFGLCRPSGTAIPANSAEQFRAKVLPPLIWTLATITFLTLAFYVASTSYYGGWNIGPRWFIWLSPLLVVCILPTVDALSRIRSGRVVVAALLTVSVASVNYRATQPWNVPWLYELIIFFDPEYRYK